MTTTADTSKFTPADLIIVHDDSYASWVFHSAHPTQGRRFINGRSRLLSAAEAASLTVQHLSPRPASPEELSLVHEAGYLAEVLQEHRSGEWAGPRPDLSDLAALFAAGTLVALEALMRGQAMTAVHLPGAKHHAQADRSSGFCVFGDFALAATLATRSGLRVAVLDIDAHHGDGTEALTADNPEVCTVSIHQAGIFPGTGLTSDPSRGVHNLPLQADAGDDGLLAAVEEALGIMQTFGPDLILVAAGADGHADDPLSSLGYTTEGYRTAARRVREVFPGVPVLIGGAGGYRPDDATPEVWAAVAVELAAGARGVDGVGIGPVLTDSGMSHSELVAGMQSIIRRAENKEKAPDLAAALQVVLPGLRLADKKGMFGAEELWLMVGEERVGALASNRLWLPPVQMFYVADQMAGRLCVVEDGQAPRKGWLRVKLAESADGPAPGTKRPAPVICPVHYIEQPLRGGCDSCLEDAA